MEKKAEWVKPDLKELTVDKTLFGPVQDSEELFDADRNPARAS